MRLGQDTQGALRLFQVAPRRVSAGHNGQITANRLSTVVDADQILVLEHGRHHQLLARNGPYASMWRRQQEAPAA